MPCLECIIACRSFDTTSRCPLMPPTFSGHSSPRHNNARRCLGGLQYLPCDTGPPSKDGSLLLETARAGPSPYRGSFGRLGPRWRLEPRWRRLCIIVKVGVEAYVISAVHQLPSAHQALVTWTVDAAEKIEDVDWKSSPNLLLEEMEAFLECTSLPLILKRLICVLDFTARLRHG